jgi:hypothetical protein
MGQILDTANLDTGTLILRQNEPQQGAMTVILDFADQKASDILNMNGQEKPISGDHCSLVLPEECS